MNRKLNFVVALGAGLLGSLVSRYVTPISVQAQTPAPKEIRAQSFVLVNGQGTPFGFLGFDPKGLPIIKLVDERGRTTWSSGQTLILPQAPTQ